MEGHDKLTVVGAGPVGSLLSIVLAQKGFQVEVYERRPDLRKVNISEGRSINLALSTRGLFALSQVGLSQTVLEVSIPMRGRIIHQKGGEVDFQPYGVREDQVLLSVSRGELNKILISAAEKTGRVQFHFSHSVAAQDYGKSITVIHEGDKRVFRSERLVAADGASSCIRDQMVRDQKCTQTVEALDYGYKELILPAQNGRAMLDTHGLHIWPRGHFMLIALPNLDGSFTCTLFLPFEGENSFSQLQTPKSVDEFFEEHFRDAKALLLDLANEFFVHPTGRMVTVKCHPWSVEDNTLLLGDAAHAIVPFFGQGMNCGFEDVSALQKMLELGEGWETLFKNFYEKRKHNTDAIAEMALENFIEMRDKVGNRDFLIQKAVEKKLQQSFPEQYVSRYALVTFSRVPYRAAQEVGWIQDALLSELCQSIHDPDEVDLKRAEELIYNKLGNRLFEISIN